MSREFERNEGAPEGFEALGAAWRSDVAADAFAAIDVAEVRRRAGDFARTIRRRNLRELAAGAVVIAAGASMAASAPTLLAKLAGAAMAAGALAVMLVIGLRARNADPPPPAAPTREVLAYERAELDRQARLLERVWAWYLAPLAPSLALFYADALLHALERTGRARTAGVATSVGLFAWSVALFVLIGWLNGRAARRLRERMAKLPGVEDDEGPRQVPR
jgi:hypothetical protein